MYLDTKPFIASPNSLGSNERLKSRKLIGLLFKEGKAFSSFPFRVLYIVLPGRPFPLQAGFSVSSRTFKKAVDRNRIKRLMRECYRTQKHPLITFTEKENSCLAVFFIYTGKEIPAYFLIKEKMAAAIGSVINKLSVIK